MLCDKLREVNEIAMLCDKLRLKDKPNIWSQELEKSGKFSVASLRYVIDDTGLRTCGTRTCWNKLVPGKTRIFYWRLWLDKLPTKAKLVVKGINPADTCCPFCHYQSEDRLHLFICCPKVKEVQKAVNSWWMIFPDDEDAKEMVFSTVQYLRKAKYDQIKDAVIQAYSWIIWKARNNAIFNNMHVNPLNIANEIQSLVFEWIRSRSRGGSNLNWFQWCCNPNALQLVTFPVLAPRQSRARFNKQPFQKKK